MTYSGQPQELPGIVADLAERLRALEARFLVAGPQGPTGPQGPGSMTLPTWQQIGSYTVTALASPVASVELLVPAGMNHVVSFWKARTNAAVTNQGMGARLNSDAGANYYDEPLYATDTVVAAGALVGQTAMRVGLVPGSTATAGLYGSGVIYFPFCSDSLHKFGFSFSGAPSSLIVGGQESQSASAWWNGTDPLTRILLLPDAGGYLTNSEFVFYGIT